MPGVNQELHRGIADANHDAIRFDADDFAEECSELSLSDLFTVKVAQVLFL